MEEEGGRGKKGRRINYGKDSRKKKGKTGQDD